MTAVLVCFAGFLETVAVPVQVPGTSNPWLAGMPNDTSSGRRPDFDYAPEHSPVAVVGVTLVPGWALLFEASGAVNKGPGWTYAGPDGDLLEIAGKVVGGEHGIADLVAPKNSLIGVFLGPEDPDFSPTPGGLNFGSTSSRDFLELQPGLKQPFFIGNGSTSWGGRQKFIVPEGATRLYLGTMDGVGWYNNGGSFTVEARVDQPEISAANVRLAEGESGETRTIVVVELSSVSVDAVTVQFATSDGTAIQGDDYHPRTGTLTIAAGKPAGTIEVAILGDTEFEPDETFFVDFSSPVNGILSVNRAVVTVVNDDPRNLPPIVALTSPIGGQIFLAGEPVPIAAAASDPDGSIAHIEFFGDGKTISNASQTPYTADWPGLDPGEHVVFVKATDNFGASVTSERVTFVVAKPIPLPPTVTLSTPESGAVFPLGPSISVAALADDRDGNIQRVDFYANSEIIGSRTESPYQILWRNAPAGAYALTATATDNADMTATSNPISVEIRDLSGDVAIVRPGDDAEVAAIKEHLNELGFSARLLHPGEITFELLRGFKLVIWSDAGRTTKSLNEHNVSALSGLFASGIPLYLTGENVASAAGHLSAEAEFAWSALTHLSSASETAGDGYIEFPTTDLSHPVITGRFGLVNSFDYPPVSDLATVSDPAAEVLGRSGSADVLVSYPAQIEEDTGGPRSITQSFPIDWSAAPGSGTELKELFQNAVCWLLRCAPCDSVNIWLEASAPDRIIKTGEPLTYSVRTFHAGECDAAGVVVTHTLPVGVLFVGAESDQGGWDRNDRVLSFHLGKLAKAAQTEIRVTVLPVSAGEFPIHIEARLNGPEVTLADNSADIALVATGGGFPTLRIDRAPGGKLDLRLVGGDGRTYDIETSSDFEMWVKAAEAKGGLWSTPLDDLAGEASASRFFRAVAP